MVLFIWVFSGKAVYGFQGTMLWHRKLALGSPPRLFITMLSHGCEVKHEMHKYVHSTDMIQLGPWDQQNWSSVFWLYLCCTWSMSCCVHILVAWMHYIFEVLCMVTDCHTPYLENIQFTHSSEIGHNVTCSMCEIQAKIQTIFFHSLLVSQFHWCRLT